MCKSSHCYDSRSVVGMGSPSNTTTILLIWPSMPSKSPRVPGIPNPNFATSQVVGTACTNCVGRSNVPLTFLHVKVSHPIPQGSITAAHWAADTSQPTLNPNGTLGFLFCFAIFLAASSCDLVSDLLCSLTLDMTSF